MNPTPATRTLLPACSAVSEERWAQTTEPGLETRTLEQIGSCAEDVNLSALSLRTITLALREYVSGSFIA
jgi:hypothetical protein